MNVTLRNPENAPRPAGPYSQVGRVELGGGALLFVSGQVALDEAGEVVAPGDMAVQSREVMRSLDALLRAEGATLADVVSIRTFLTDMSRLPEYAAARREFLPGTPPTSTTVEVSALFRPGAVIEVEVVAALPARAG
ncbi:RidA family protein [Actinorugispora endophytica]|uniref:Enamine deaminase RidA (YjgF/YER057c/UK114 family) n=1 Tax=Actinorugispora endophytica TaxID=1605990 RepID=A0A4R6V2L6_9ACTN|nr:RidA family protein [Actinorugispora endophytica]TDQ54213.1 enamine deaminase RidA (YjgF/YER057c/UK114 family) [Actinorugispora endophytica]